MTPIRVERHLKMLAEAMESWVTEREGMLSRPQVRDLMTFATRVRTIADEAHQVVLELVTRFPRKRNGK